MHQQAVLQSLRSFRRHTARGAEAKALFLVGCGEFFDQPLRKTAFSYMKHNGVNHDEV